MSWIEISITVEDGELAEAVAEVLSRYIPDGVFIQATGIVFDPDSEGRGIAPYRVGGYLPEDDPKSARANIERAIGHLSLIRPIPAPEFQTIEDIDWTESWKQHFHALPVGEKLLILPAWEEVPVDSAPPGRDPRYGNENPAPEQHPREGARKARIPVRIDPGMAFGTGTHPTTQLALVLLEQALAQNPGADVIDVGCGSGILSIAAAKLGAARVIGVDIDPESNDNARKNAALNDVTQAVTFGPGSVAELLAGEYGLRGAPVVVANILAHILVKLLDGGLGRLVSDRGVLILSGILDERESEVVEAAVRDGFSVTGRLQEGDWVALVISRGSV